MYKSAVTTHRPSVMSESPLKDDAKTPSRVTVKKPDVPRIHISAARMSVASINNQDMSPSRMTDKSNTASTKVTPNKLL